MRTIVAILALAPAMLHAQATAPAQPSSTPVLTSNLNSPLLLAEKSAASTPALGNHRVSTGVVGPRLIHSAPLQRSSATSVRALTGSGPRKVVVAMTVDATGKPGDLKVVQNADPVTDGEVLDTVARFRYEPATVSGVPTAVPLTLEVNVTSGSIY